MFHVHYKLYIVCCNLSLVPVVTYSRLFLVLLLLSILLVNKDEYIVQI